MEEENLPASKMSKNLMMVVEEVIKVLDGLNFEDQNEVLTAVVGEITRLRLIHSLSLTRQAQELRNFTSDLHTNMAKTIEEIILKNS